MCDYVRFLQIRLHIYSTIQRQRRLVRMITKLAN